jgi:methionyl-tRNA synthetase
VTAVREAAASFEAYAPSRALEAIWRLVRETNRYVDTAQPWKLAKDPDRRAELEHTAHSFLEALFWAARMVAPVMPNKAAEILAQLGIEGDAAQRAMERWPDAERAGRDLDAGLTVSKPSPLFPRIDEDRAAALLDRWVPEDARR